MTEQYRQECEAREWIARYKQKVNKLGKDKANDWFFAVISVITKKRGEQSANKLRENIRKENAKSSKD